MTEREKSPGALSLSRMRKAPSCRCLLSISSALALGILPKNHLRDKASRCVSVSLQKGARQRRRGEARVPGAHMPLAHGGPLSKGPWSPRGSL